MIRAITLAAAALMADSGESSSQPKVGDVYDLVSQRETVGQSNRGSSSSTSDRDAITERVIGVRADGLEVEYDLPQSASAAERAGSWQSPARVFRSTYGKLELLNGAELEGRVDGWLKSGGMTRVACGHLIFTWNAFRIECDPKSVLKALTPFEMGPRYLHDGLSYQTDDARAPARIAKVMGSPEGATYTVTLEINPDTVRRRRAETDLGVAEITKKPLTLGDALRAHATEQISGTITIIFETDSNSVIQKRLSVTKLTIKKADGEVETQSATQALTRRLAPRPKSTSTT